MLKNKYKIPEDTIKLFNEYISDDTLVIGILRSGAHIPHIYQNACRNEGIKPQKINLILSHMISFFPKNFFHERKILILDDTVFNGSTMQQVKDNLLDLGADPTKIRTATLVVNSDSKYEPDFPKTKKCLDLVNYIAWKEEFCSIIADDIRPTERDHPLYYFNSNNLRISDFLAILQDYGQIHSVGNALGSVVKISLSIDSSNLSIPLEIKGVDIGDLFKIRFYIKQIGKKTFFTFVPICFPTINISEFLETSADHLAKYFCLNEDFFTNIFDKFGTLSHQMIYYFVSRGLAAEMLNNLLLNIIPRIRFSGIDFSILNPKYVDGSINYIFPHEYSTFYNTYFDRYTQILSQTKVFESFPFTEKWRIPEPYNNKFENRKNTLTPNTFSILTLLVDEKSPVFWDGNSWIPNEKMIGITFHEILKKFNNKVFISKALDELLESGLLRAEDGQTEETKGGFSRIFLPGGEYNSIALSRIADTFNFVGTFQCDNNLAEEEAIDLWGYFS